MVSSTEAACLLQLGSMYPARVGLVVGADEFFLGVKAGAFSLYRGDAPIFHFDPEGRWQRAFIEGLHYLKGLDTTVRAIGRGREGSGLVLRRRVLGPDEAEALDESIRGAARDLIDAIDRGEAAILPPPDGVREIGPAESRGLLGQVAAWDADAWAGHRARFDATYQGPWPFLPPDCPNPIVLLATMGLAFGREGSEDMRARTVREFEEHLAAVEALLGRRVEQCRDVFLGGTDLLHQPVDQVLGYLDAIGTRFGSLFGSGPESRAHQVHAFLNDFRPPLPELDGWRRLKAGRLGRVTLGIESGDPTTRKSLDKLGTGGEVGSTVEDLKAAGIGVGLVVLVGSEATEAHLEATSRIIESLPLDRGDLVTLVEARAPDGDGAPPPLDPIAELKRRISADRSSNRPRVVAYNPDKQWA